MLLITKKRLLLLPILCCLPFLVNAQNENPEEIALKLREVGMRSGLAWEIVEGLTTEVGARLAGTEADHRAVEWAERKLDSLSFDRVWLERIEFPVWTRHHEVARIVAPYPQDLHVTALGYSGSTDGEITAEVIGFADLDTFSQRPSRAGQGQVRIYQSIHRADTNRFRVRGCRECTLCFRFARQGKGRARRTDTFDRYGQPSVSAHRCVHHG